MPIVTGGQRSGGLGDGEAEDELSLEAQKTSGHPRSAFSREHRVRSGCRTPTSSSTPAAADELRERERAQVRAPSALTSSLSSEAPSSSASRDRSRGASARRSTGRTRRPRRRRPAPSAEYSSVRRVLHRYPRASARDRRPTRDAGSGGSVARSTKSGVVDTAAPGPSSAGQGRRRGGSARARLRTPGERDRLDDLELGVREAFLPLRLVAVDGIPLGRPSRSSTTKRFGPPSPPPPGGSNRMRNSPPVAGARTSLGVRRRTRSHTREGNSVSASPASTIRGDPWRSSGRAKAE